MNEIKKESIIVSAFILLAILANIGINMMGIASMIALPVVIGCLIYFGIKSDYFKTEKLLSIFAIYYKMVFIIALYFASKDYPGKDIFYAVGLISTLVYIVLVYFKNRGKSQIVQAVIYINLFSAIIASIR